MIISSIKRKLPVIGIVTGLAVSILPSSAQQAPQRDAACSPVSLTYQEAQSIVDALGGMAPPELRAGSTEALAKAWPAWAARHSAAVRERLSRGDEDLLANLILFGTSFTSQPRLTPKDLASMTGRAAARNLSGTGQDVGSLAGEVLGARLSDFVRALETPAKNDRLLYLRRVLERKGHSFSKSTDRNQLRQYLVTNLLRVLGEQKEYAKALEEAGRFGDSSAEFAARSTLYRERGLAVDTSLFPGFAIEETLKAMQARGLLASVKRAAVIGPGLDFADKQGGYDFYPEQTMQPFALIDSLAKLGLSEIKKLEVTAFDIHPRVIGHLLSARQRAARGTPYVVQLPRNLDSSWKPGVLSYWQSFGGLVGLPSTPVPIPPGIRRLRLRAVNIRPDVVSRVAPCELDIVLQRLDLPETLKFDLMVATNVFIYYEPFEQSLALANIAEMLKPGGFLLSNNALPEIPNSPIQSVDYLTVVYSEDRPDDGDHIVWYQRRPKSESR